MARRESDREDLMAEATALVQRAQFAMPHDAPGVIAGFRRDGTLSLYFGQDPCYHFDADLRLRRAFVDGLLYRTQGRTLTRLERHRTEETVELLRHDLSEAQWQTFCAQAVDRLRRLHTALLENAPCVQQVPPGEDLRARVIESLHRLLQQPLALAPAFPGRR